MTRIAILPKCWIVFCAILYAALIGSSHPAAGIIQTGHRFGGCTYDIECDDGMPCTTDRCDFPPDGPVGSGVCQHTPVPNGQPGGVGGPDCAPNYGLRCGGCDDGIFCNGAETCQAGACASGTPPCSGGQVCSESLNLCQGGPCSEQKACIGGPTPGTACTTNFGCGNGGLCRFADCDDGLHCNGDETCVAGICQAGENPCGFGAACGERQCSIGAQIDLCFTDEDCLPRSGSTIGGTCSLLGPVCLTGRCCTGSTEPACSRRMPKGICLGTTPGTNAGSACLGDSECNSNNCTQEGASCAGVGGHFYPGDAGAIPTGGGIACPVINDIQMRCPKYGSGVTPHGPVNGHVGAVSDSNIVNVDTGVPLNKLGDDYNFSNAGVCVGGPRNGLGCGAETDCPSGGVCNLAATSVMSVYYLRVLGGFFPETQVVVEFRDAAGRFVGESYAQRETAAEMQRFFIDPPLVVPSRGFVVLRVAAEFTPNGGFVWASTDAVDVGFNDPGVLWVNDGPVSNFLAPNPGILIFELEGEKVVAPLGACCASDGTSCIDGVLPWVCEGDGDHFQGAGSTCPAPACDSGACCNPNTGACTVGTETDCANASGDFQGYGTECDADHGYDSGQQHCCPQPSSNFTGADKCQDVIFHVVTAPPVGETRVITITGDNSSATLQAEETLCYSGGEATSQDLGWYEGFDSIECLMVRVDYCCTEPVKRPAYHALFDECPCSTPIMSTANPYQFPLPDHAAGSPYCDDQNEWATFGVLPAGHYYIPVHSALPGSFGPYQMHISAEACPLAACCVADQCTDGVNQLECNALGGTFLAPPQTVPVVGDCSSAPCATGSCCSGPGQCFDLTLGQPVTPADCAAVQGTYHGGVRCFGGRCQDAPNVSCHPSQEIQQCNGECVGTNQEIAQPSPCPICTIEGSANCQAFDDAFYFTLSDRHLGSDGILAADDFRPDSGTLDHVCVWGFYLDGDPDAVTADCGPFVSDDHFRVRVFANDPATGRSPGVYVGGSTATSQKGIIPQTRIHTRLLTNVYGYDIVLDAPIVGLTPGEVYWIEVSNDVSDSHPTCNWFWGQLWPTSTSFSFTGSDIGYSSGDATPFENAFCLNMPFSPTGIGAIPGGCCTCDGGCSPETLATCANQNGTWDITSTTCTGVTCAVATPNDNCIDGPPTIVVGSYNVSNQCATTDGYGPIPSDFDPFEGSQLDFDLWYNFIAPSSCDLVVSECRTGLTFDSMLAVYMNCPPGSPPECDETICPPCPLDSATSEATLAGLAQDESCSGRVGGPGYWKASEQIGREAAPGECFLLRIGSFPGNRGTAMLDISCDCIPNLQPVCEPYFIKYTRFIALGCGLFHPCQNPIPVEGAIRVHLTSLHHVDPPYTGGPSIPFTSFEGQVRWAGPPAQYVESTATPTPFWVSQLQCTPHYQDWSSIPLLYVTGSEIVPSSTYMYELLKPTCVGNEAACLDVSPTFSVNTTRWGDVETPYNPPSTTAQPDVGDISALVNKFKNAPGAPGKARALLAGADQFGSVNIGPDLDFSHIAACVDAFRGQPYPYTIIDCP